jgi:transcriptional regulator GlxA family with amidase domain
MRRAVDRMRLHSQRPLRVAELARLAGLGESHFTRQFRHLFGTSPIDWLRGERLLRAQRRLAESADSMKEIARQCGWGDPFHFSKDFKRLTGMTPTEYRRRERGE